MDLILGLSITSAAIRFVLVEGSTGEGATVDKGTLGLDGTDIGSSGLGDLVDAVLGEGPFAAVPGRRPRAIGVTWVASATATAAPVLELLATKGATNVIAVSETDAAAALATGIADLAGLEDLTVCVVEPDSAVAAVVDTHEVVMDVVTRSGYGDVEHLAPWLTTLVDTRHTVPASVYVLGTAEDLDEAVAAIGAAGFPVVSAAEADLALARGAALASAHSTYGLDLDPAAPPAPADGAASGRRPRIAPRTAALVGVLAAAVVTFVVSVSVALTPSTDTEHHQAATTSEQAVKASKPEPAVKLPPRPAPAAPPKVAPPEAPPPPPPAALPVEPVEALPPIPEAAPAPAPEIPAAPPAPHGLPQPAPAYVAPEPAYVAPAPAPAYVPPAPAPVPAVDGVPPGFVPGNPAYVPPGPNGTVPAYQAPQPRLRDRIIERLPIINRFHEPQR